MKTKRIVSLLLVLAMAFSFAACGGKEKEPESTEPAKTYTEIKQGDEGVGPFDGSTLCADFSIPADVKYKVSSYEVDLDVHRYSLRMQLGKSSSYSNPYSIEMGYSYNETIEEEVATFIQTNTVGNIVATATDDITVGDKTLKGVHVSSDNSDDIDYYIYVFDSAETGGRMKLIFQINRNFNDYNADDDADILSVLENSVLK